MVYEADKHNYDGKLNLFDSPDETAIRQSIYNSEKVKYPVNPKMDCQQIQAAVDNIQLDIDAAIATKTQDDSKGNQRIQNRVIDGCTQYRNEVQALYNKNNCAKQITDQESKDFFNSQFTNLQQVQSLSSKAGLTTKVLIIGMLVVVVGVAGVIIFKKKK